MAIIRNNKVVLGRYIDKAKTPVHVRGSPKLFVFFSLRRTFSHQCKVRSKWHQKTDLFLHETQTSIPAENPDHSRSF